MWVGLAGGAAASIKALSVPAIVIAGRRAAARAPARVRDAALAAAIALGVYLVTALPWGLGPGARTSRSRTTTTPGG